MTFLSRQKGRLPLAATRKLDMTTTLRGDGLGLPFI
jgi:hypothetical protein